MSQLPKAVVLLSGGLDSTTVLAYAKSKGYDCHCLSFNYGQRHNAELAAAQRIVEDFQIKHHHIIDIPSFQFGGSALTDHSIDVPEYAGDDQIPVTYVPARNTIFLSFALALAETVKANDIFIGASYVDYSGYPDCRSEYFEAFQHLANLATKAGVEDSQFKIHAPLLHLSKAETIKLGHKLNVDYSLTISCYQADNQGRACGQCDSCYLRKKGFNDANVEDPTLYQ